MIKSVSKSTLGRRKIYGSPLWWIDLCHKVFILYLDLFFHTSHEFTHFVVKDGFDAARTIFHVIALLGDYASLILRHILLELIQLGHLDGLGVVQVAEVGLLRLHHLANGQMQHVFDCKCVFVHVEVAVERV